MRLLSLSLAVLISNISAIAQALPSNTQYLCSDNLSDSIEKIISIPRYRRAHWGIYIEALKSGRILYSLNSDKYFIPASSVKLLTTAALIAELGGNYRIETPIYTTGSTPNLSSLRIEGQGDPTISTESLKNITLQLQLQGVKKIEKLIVDDRYFSTPRINPTWEWSDIYSYYATSVSSLILDRNTVTLTLLPQQLGQPIQFKWNNAIANRQWKIINRAITAPENTPYKINIDSILGEAILNISGELAIDEPPDIWNLAVVDPANYFLESAWSILERAGIDVVRGEVARTNYQNNLEIKNINLLSPNLSKIITEINRESNNLYAEVLSQVLRKKVQTDTNIEAIELSLSKLNINPEQYLLKDASGLSRHNLIMPKTLVKILKIMSKHRDRDLYKNSLAISGKTGTLKNRFKNTNIEAKLWGKTGTLKGISTLTGYLHLPKYETLIFTIIVNHSNLSSEELRRTIDRIVILLGNLKKC